MAKSLKRQLAEATTGAKAKAMAELENRVRAALPPALAESIAPAAPPLPPYNPAALHLKYGPEAKDEALREFRKGSDAPIDAPGVTDQLNARLHAKANADGFSNPAVLGASLQHEFGQTMFTGLEVDRLVGNLEQAVARIKNGDMGDVEAMLFSQAQALNSIFASFAFRATKQEHIQKLQMYLTLALKAQSQCRNTLEALAYVKNPPNVNFIRQQNNAHNQQVNGSAPPTQARTGDLPDQPNKLLAVGHEKAERLDAGAPAGTIGQDSKLEAVGAGHGAADAAG